MMTVPKRTTRADPSRSANAMAEASRPKDIGRVLSLAQKQAQASREKQCPAGQEDMHVPDYPRALFYPLLPWGAPQSAFPASRMRGQRRMLYWEIVTICAVAYTGAKQILVREEALLNPKET